MHESSSSTKEDLSSSTTKRNNSHVLGSQQQQQQRRGREEAVFVVFHKSLKTAAVSSTVTVLLVCLLCCCFQVASAFQPSTGIATSCPPLQQQPITMMRLLGQRRRRRPSSVSGRLFSSVAATNTADSTTTSTTSTVDLKYMEYLPHDNSSGSGKHHHQHPPVVFLHGLLGNKKNFATIATSLGNQLTKKRRIIGLDLRNHGDNHHDWRDSMNYSEMAQDLLAFLDAQDIPKAVLVGHSMGGKVAQAVALTEPSRVDGLVVLDIAPVAYCKHDDPHWKAVQDIVTVLAKLPVGPGVTRRDVDVQLRAAIPDPALRAFCLTNFDATTGQWKIHIQAICAQLDEIASFDISSSSLNNNNGKSSNGEEVEMEQQQQQQQQQQYPGDAFFIHGGQSRFVRHAYIPAIQSYFPNHMLTTVRGAGHWIHAEKPEDTIALLKRFLER